MLPIWIYRRSMTILPRPTCRETQTIQNLTQSSRLLSVHLKNLYNNIKTSRNKYHLKWKFPWFKIHLAATVSISRSSSMSQWLIASAAYMVLYHQLTTMLTRGQACIPITFPIKEAPFLTSETFLMLREAARRTRRRSIEIGKICEYTKIKNSISSKVLVTATSKASIDCNISLHNSIINSTHQRSKVAKSTTMLSPRSQSVISITFR